MIRRNAPIAKIITAALCILAVVYLLYIFNETSGKLKDTERVANRYRREQEALSSQLSDLRSEKENLQQRCDNERKEYQSRLSSSNQQYKMLQSQNEDLQSDHSRLRDDCNKDKEDHKLHDAQQNQEYMQLKQEKELEIASLKDEVANIKREKDTLNDEISKLKSGLENSQKNWKLENKERLSLEKQVGYLKKEVASYQVSVNSLQEQNRAFETKIGFLQAQYEQAQQQKQQILQQQNLQQQNLQQQQQKQQVLQQQQQKQQVLQQQNQPQQQQNIPQNNQQQPVVNGNIVNNLQNAANQVGGNIQNAANQLAGNLQHMAKNVGAGDVGGFIKSLGDKANELIQKDKEIVPLDQGKSQQEKEKEKAQELEKKNKLIDEQQQQHQVLPPNRNGNEDDDKLEVKGQLQKDDKPIITDKPTSSGPNIKPPKFNEEPKESGRNSDVKVQSVKDRIGVVEPVHQVQPPGGHIMDVLKNGQTSGKKENKEIDSVNIDSNLQLPNGMGGLNPHELNQQQNIPPPNVGIKTEKQPMEGGNLQQVNIPPPKRMFEVPRLLETLKKDGVKQPALPEM